MSNWIFSISKNFFLKRVYEIFYWIGFDFLKIFTFLYGLPYYIITLLEYIIKSNHDSIKIRTLFPILVDRFYEAGQAKGHYFFQDLWAARKIYERRTQRHIDIGSSITGFVSHLLVFMDVEVIDIRPLNSTIKGLSFIQLDATNLDQFEDNSLDSISSLHACEHFGLGRYGDLINPEAHKIFIKSLIRVLKPGGRLYFSVPIGKERVEFNAHRIFSPITILNEFKKLELVSFSCIKDDDRFYENYDPTQLTNEKYACGLFEFTKN